MNAEDIRRIARQQPFKPFDILTVDGRKFHVPHPDFVFAPPHPRANFVIVAHTDGTVEHVNTLIISSVNCAKIGRNGRRKAG